MKKWLIAFVMMGCGANMSAQTAAKALYVELGGPGIASINYDMRFSKSEKGFGGRVGIGGFSIGTKEERGTVIFVPLAINYIMTKDDRKYFELGAGITPVILKETSSNNNENIRSSFGHVNFAYRYQPKEGGVFFRAAITPIFSKSFFWPYYGGLSIGYKF